MALTYWIQQGAEKKKLVAGIPFYGRTFTAESPENIYMGATNVGIGNAGRFTREKGFMAYYEVSRNELQ